MEQLHTNQLGEQSKCQPARLLPKMEEKLKEPQNLLKHKLHLNIAILRIDNNTIENLIVIINAEKASDYN